MHARHVCDVNAKSFLIRPRVKALLSCLAVIGASNIFNVTFTPEFFALKSDVWKSVRRSHVAVKMLGEEVSGTELPLRRWCEATGEKLVVLQENSK